MFPDVYTQFFTIFRDEYGVSSEFVDEKSHKSPQVNMERRLMFTFLQVFLMFTSFFYLFHHRVILQ
jgi:hypothetical protein